MLVDLHVRNLAVLAGAEVELGPGLNVLTGETGAGKSIVVDALQLLAGGRASVDLVRTGSEQLSVTGIFRARDPEVGAALAAAGLEPDAGELVVRREIGREGRNRVYVNDQPVTLRLLTDLAPRLLRLHGQRDELALAEAGLQRLWLDRSGGAAAAEQLAAVAALHARWSGLAARLERLRGDARAREERRDLLRFQLGEIERAAPRPGEEDELRQERDRLRHREAIARALGGALDLLVEGEGAAGERLGRARELLREIAAFEPAAAAAVAGLGEAAGLIDDLARELRGAIPGEEEAGRLDLVEDRLAALERLLRRHGGTTVELLAAGERWAAELAELDHDEGHREELEAEVAASLAAFREAALALSAARAGWGATLERALAAELADLALPHAALAVRLDRRSAAASPLIVDGRAVEFGSHGVDVVVFEFSPNPGEAAQPLARIASGGELSRLYLALQLAARAEDQPDGGPTLVFDEVDAGVGGAEAAAVGRKLQRLASACQVLAVTHLPQVAAHADRHFKVEKRVEGGRTFATVRLLDEAGRTEELARMLGGERLTAKSRSHAAELRGAARRAGAK